MLKRCWSMEPSKRPTASEILEIFTYSPQLICPSIDVPKASVQMDRDISFEIMSKSRKPSDLLNLKLLISSTQGNSEDKSYSTMTGQTLSPLHEDLLVNKYKCESENSEEENYTGQSSPFLPGKHSFDSDLLSNYVESGYMVSNSWKLSNSVNSSIGNL